MKHTSQINPISSHNAFAFSIYTILTCCVCALLPAYPALTLILVTIWGVLILLAGLYFSSVCLLIMAALNAAVIFWQAGLDGLAFYGAFFGLAIFTMGIFVSIGRNYYQIRTRGIIAATLGVTLYLGAMYFGQGSIGTQELERELQTAFQDSLQNYEAKGLLDFYAQEGISKEEIETKFRELAGSLSRHLPAIYYLQVIVAVFFMLLIASNMSLRRKTERLIRKPYHSEMMPWPLAWLVISGLTLWLWGYNEKSSYYYMGSNILVIMVPIAFYYGLAALIHMLGKMTAAPRRWIIFLLIITSLAFLPTTIIFLSLAGLFDSLLDFRKMRLRREES